MKAAGEALKVGGTYERSCRRQVCQYVTRSNVAMPAARMLDRYGRIHWVNNTATTRQTHNNLASVEHIKAQGDPMNHPFQPFAPCNAHTPPDYDG